MLYIDGYVAMKLKGQKNLPTDPVLEDLARLQRSMRKSFLNWRINLPDSLTVPRPTGPSAFA